MPYDPGMLSQGSEDTGSPLTAVLQYLSTKGYPPNAANIKAAIEANARDPGVIPGLRNAGVEDSAPAPSGVRAPVRGGTPQNAINESLGEGEITPGMGSGTYPTADTGGGGNLGSWILGLLGLPGVAGARAALGSRPGVAPEPVPTQPPADTVGTASKPEGTTSAPPESSQEAAMRKATDGSPVEGVKPANPDIVTGRSQGPTTSVEGAEVPQMPPTSSTRTPPAPPPQVTEPGAARVQSFKRPPIPRVVRPPLPRL